MKVVGRIADLTALIAEYKLLIVAIGNNSLRERIYREAEIIGYQFLNIIASNVYISPYKNFSYGKGVLRHRFLKNATEGLPSLLVFRFSLRFVAFCFFEGTFDMLERKLSYFLPIIMLYRKLDYFRKES